MQICHQTLLLNMQENVLKLKTSNSKTRAKVIELMQQKPKAMMRSIFSPKKAPGISNVEALINTVWLFNSLHFGLRGHGEHRQMCGRDVQLMKDADGTEYLHFSERQTKTRSGAYRRNVLLIKPKAFATPDFLAE